MERVNVTSPQAARCLQILEQADRAVVAIELAERLGIGGNRETRRRHVRAIIEQLRETGAMVVATLQDGYFLTEDTSLWRNYLDGRQIDAKKILGQTHRKKRMITDAKGQGLLFMQQIYCGAAMMGAG